MRAGTGAGAGAGAGSGAGAVGRGIAVLLMLLLLLLLLSKAVAQRPTPAPPQAKSILLKGGTLHVGNGTVIDDGAVGFRNGVIDFVGHSYGVKEAYDTIIVTDGQQIYPGFILPDNTLGLHEIDLVRATDDEDETGEMEPEVRAMSAFNVDSRIIPTVRSNGVLIDPGHTARRRDQRQQQHHAVGCVGQRGGHRACG